MTDLSTTYMGVKLANPIIAGACGLTSNIRSIRDIEKAGAGALVIKSLFEEQVLLERFKFDEDLHKYDSRNAEMITVFRDTPYQGPQEHLMWVREAKKAVHIPVFASLNAVSRETWLEYAKLLAETGVDGLECNFFASPGEQRAPGAGIEEQQVRMVEELVQTVSIPVSVKLSSFYTNPLAVIHRMDEVDARGFVLFNRLFEPDIDLSLEKVVSPLNFSHATDCRLPLQYAALLEGSVKADICCSTGIADGEQVAKMIMAGAAAVQVVSALYRHGIAHISKMRDDTTRWMESRGYHSLADFRGKLSQRHVPAFTDYTRAQYVKLLMNPEALIKNAPVL